MNLAVLRPGYFTKNTLMQIGAIKESGQMYTVFNGETPIPMIANRDIAARAAELLVERNGTGHRIAELQGPEDVSYDQVAAILSEILERDVEHITVTPKHFKESLLGMGASEHIADLFNEMGASMDARRIAFSQPRIDATATPTTYAVFAREVFKTAYNMA